VGGVAQLGRVRNNFQSSRRTSSYPIAFVLRSDRPRCFGPTRVEPGRVALCQEQYQDSNPSTATAYASQADDSTSRPIRAADCGRRSRRWAVSASQGRCRRLRWPALYGEFRKLVAVKLAQENLGQTLQATALWPAPRVARNRAERRSTNCMSRCSKGPVGCNSTAR